MSDQLDAYRERFPILAQTCYLNNNSFNLGKLFECINTLKPQVIRGNIQASGYVTLLVTEASA